MRARDGEMINIKELRGLAREFFLSVRTSSLLLPSPQGRVNAGFATPAGSSRVICTLSIRALGKILESPSGGWVLGFKRSSKTGGRV